MDKRAFLKETSERTKLNMDKRGNLKIVIILIGLIVIVILLLALNFLRYYFEAKTLGKQLEEKNVTYYLPAEFAVIKIERGDFDADISGIRILFLDNEKNKYYYETSNYPDAVQSKQYIIMKDELIPPPANNWDFSKARRISFAFIFPSGRISREVYSIRVNQEDSANNFKGNCFIANGSEGNKITCT